VQLDAEGAPVATALTERLISIDAERLRAVDDVIGLVYGAEKADAVLAALRGGFVTSLVTHGAMARALLKP
jgi:DNA-binding transcriptional regulator LsrR (DeoR family)